MLPRWLGYLVLATMLAIVGLVPSSLAAASAEVVIGEGRARTEPMVCSGTRFEEICVAP
jgi:hypothetical protein